MAQTLTYAQLVAQALPHRPEMLAIARDNVTGWLATGQHPVAPLTEWDGFWRQRRPIPPHWPRLLLR